MKKKTFRWYNSIRIKIPAIIILIIIIPVIIFWQYNSNNLKKNIMDNTEVIVESGLSNLSISIEYMLNKVTNFAKLQVNDKELLTLLDSYLDAPEDEREKARSQLTLYLTQQVIDSDLVASAYIVELGGENIVTTVYGAKEVSVNTEEGQIIYDQYRDSKVNVISWYTAPNGLGNGAVALSYIRPIALQNTKYSNISLICNMDNAELSEMINAITLDESFVMVTSYDGEVMLSAGTDAEAFAADADFEALKTRLESGSSVMNIGGKDYLVVNKRSLQTSWNYIEAVPLDVVYGDLYSQLSMIYVIAVISICVSVLGALIVAGYVVKPIKRLVGGMNQTGKGELVALPDTSRNDELGFMLNGYNTMVRKLKSLIDELYIKELLRKEAELLSLQSQINEHFLYNVLNSIYCIAKRENAEDSAEMIGILSKFFRLSLSKGREFVTIGDIIQLIQYYLWIQKVRYGERFLFDITVSPGLTGKYVLKYLFQPIVENAVLHGIESKNGEGHINISFEQLDGQLLFRVRDNGVGISAEKLEELYKVFSQHTKIEGDNFALKNINAQIKMVYGEEFGLQIKSDPRSDTEVGFVIPLKESGDIK